MKAIVYTQYGPPDVLTFQEVEKPTPAANEVLVKVQAASVNAGDWHALRGTPFVVRLMAGLRRPRNPILGDDIAGRVEAVGTAVKQFQPGDEVFGCSDGGAFAEYRCVTEAKIAPKPAAISIEQAASLPVAGLTALQGLRDHGRIQAGHKVLISGASGGVGTFAVQLAKCFDAEVTGVCSSAKVDLVRSLGADHVIDYTREDFTTSGRRYDVILAVGGNHPLGAYRRLLTEAGSYVCIGGTAKQYLQGALLGPVLTMRSRQKMTSMFASVSQDDLKFLTDCITEGKVVPVIDKTYPLRETADAIRYLEAGHARGKVVIAVA